MRCLVLLLLLCTIKVVGQQQLSLDDCISYGLTHHGSITIAENNRLSSDAAVKEVVAGYLPKVTVNGSIDDNLKVQEQVIPAGLFSDEDMRVAFTKQFNTTASVQADQVIYDQSLIVGIKAGKYTKQQATLTKKQKEEELVYQISSYYYQCWVYEAQLQFLVENKTSFENQLQIAGLQLDKGVLAQVDYNRLQVNYNTILSNIRTATHNLTTSKNTLKNTMGYPIEEELVLAKVTRVPEDILSTAAIDGSFSLEQRSDFQLDSLQTKLLELDYKRIKYGNLPKLSFYARYGTIGFGDNLSESFNTQQSFSAIGLKLSATLFEGFGKTARAKQAKLKFENAETQQKLNANSYRVEIVNATNKLKTAQAAINEELENIDLAESVFKATDLQYQKGVTSLKYWLDDQLALKEAQHNYLQAVVDYYVASVELKKSTGTLYNTY